MIEINLLPGDNKKKRRSKTATATKFEFNLKPPAWLAGITEGITDKYMLGAIGAAAISGALIVLLFISQTARGAMLEARETKAVKDSAQFSAVLNAKARAEATRDSIQRWKERGDWQKLRCLELLLVCGLANKDVAQRTGLTEQQVANLKSDFYIRLKSIIQRSGLDADVFPELHTTA